MEAGPTAGTERIWVEIGDSGVLDGGAGRTVTGAALVLKREATSADDRALAAFAASVELAAAATYEAVAVGLTGAPLALVQRLVVHHRSHARALNVQAGAKAVTTANAGLAAGLGSKFSAAIGQTALVRLAFQLENQLASTYQFLLGKVSSTATLRLVASILPVEGQHATVLGQLLGLDLQKDLIPVTFQGMDGPSTHPEWGFLDPARYPVGG